MDVLLASAREMVARLQKKLMASGHGVVRGESVSLLWSGQCGTVKDVLEERLLKRTRGWLK